MSVVRVTYSTMGQSSPSSVAEGTGYYRYRGKQPLQAETPDEVHPGNADRTAGRAARLAEFAGYLAQGLTTQQAGKLVRIAPATAREYARELERQQRGESAP